MMNVKSLFLALPLLLLCSFFPLQAVNAIEFSESSLYSSPNNKAYWKLENLVDDIGIYDLTAFNTPTVVSAKFNNGYSFDNTYSQSLATSSNLGTTYNGTTTYAFWFKLTSEVPGGTCYTLLQQNFIDNPGTYRHINYCDGIYAGGGTKTLTWTTNSNITRTGSLNDSAWHFVVWTASSSIDAYLDNVKIGYDTQFTGNYSARGDYFSLGALKNLIDNQYHSDVIIDDVVVSQDYWTAEDVEEMYTDAPPAEEEPTASSTASYCYPEELNDYAFISSCAYATSGVTYTNYHVPFFFWVIVATITIFIFNRIIIEFLIRWRKRTENENI